MSKNEIIQMARQAGLCDANGEDNDSVNIAGHLERFSTLIAAAEREACAKVCDVLSTHPEYASEVTKLAAQAIRARGNE